MADGTSFTELSVDRLASEAGISRASFYIYFEDKGSLLRRLAGAVFSDLADAADSWWSVAQRHDPADVRLSMTRLVASYRAHQPVLIALSEMAGYDPLVGSTYRDILNGIAERVTRVITDGQEAGAVRPELPAASTASALTWMAERACQQNLPHREPEYDAELAETLAQIVWSTLYLRPLPPP